MQIDYVVTWVDGQDPKHKAARKACLVAERKAKGGQAPNREESRHGFEQTTKIRFQDNGELYYNIASVLLYAPFIRRIFIVTDSQTPALLSSFAQEGKCAADFLQLVSHDAIFPQGAARPSFSSRAIEACLWRIPGLSEHFIFSNDDFFLNAPAQAADFFRHGRPRLGGTWRRARGAGLRRLLRAALEHISRYQSPSGHGQSQWLAAKYAGGGGRYFSAPHCPHPLRQSVFAAFFRQNPQLLQRQLRFRFRSARQFNPVALANHLELRQYSETQGGAQPEPSPPIAYLDTIKSPQHYAAVLAEIKSAAAPYGCIQDMGLYPPRCQAELHRALLEKFGSVLPEAVKQHILSQIAAL